MSEQTERSIAAVDLGSNSFHLIVARVCDGHLHILDRMKEMVRLAAGLDAHNRITDEAMDRAIDCLARFGERLRDIPLGDVRIVGTNTLRLARNSKRFIRRAEAALGHPIDIIAGREEARLIYLGVSHSLEDDQVRRLVMDIGGGSTEFILGRHFIPELTESLFMGCVSMSRRYFADGRITEQRMRAAEIAAQQELEGIREAYLRSGWDTAIGASGTILSIRDVVLAQGWSKDGISASSLNKLRKALISTGHSDKLVFEGLAEERRAVFAGGVAIMTASFELLGIDLMRVSSGALREGLLYDHLGRIHHEDVRERTIEGLVQRYQIDTDQARRVRGTAIALLRQTPPEWGVLGVENEGLISRAASLYEIGLAISHNQYHKHGGYLVRNMDMPGFARGEQTLIATLIRGHRRKFPQAVFRDLSRENARNARRLCMLLRLAVLLHRGRGQTELPSIHLQAEGKRVALKFPLDWLQEHPLTQADLGQEAAYLKAVGRRLTFS